MIDDFWRIKFKQCGVYKIAYMWSCNHDFQKIGFNGMIWDLMKVDSLKHLDKIKGHKIVYTKIAEWKNKSCKYN